MTSMSLHNINSSSTLTTNLLISSWETTPSFTVTNFSDTTQVNDSSPDRILHQSTSLSLLPAAEADNEVTLIGWPGPMFTVIHGVALCSLSTTILVSSGLLIFLCLCRNKGNHSHQQTKPPTKQDRERSTELTSADSHSTLSTTSTTKNGVAVVSSHKGDIENRSKMATVNKSKKQKSDSFWTWNMGERMVVYLAICDLCFGTVHTTDHSYMMAHKSHPPDNICATMGFFLLSAILSQWFVVSFSALSACSLVVFGKKLSSGRYDWRFLVGTFGFAVVIAAISWSLGMLGPSGAWCFSDIRTSRGRLFNEILGVIQICAFIVVTLAYGAIWIKIQRTARLMSSRDSRYDNSARIMMIFVAVFIFQGWPVIVSNVWSLVSVPPAGIYVTAVLVINLCGIYNCIAYTVIRRRLQQQKTSRGPQVVLSHSDKAATHVQAMGVNKECTMSGISCETNPVV